MTQNTYKDNYGVEFTADKKSLIYCPNTFEGNYVIPETVTRIEEFAFVGCAGLKSITIPDSVREIGEGAFNGCDNLKEIIVPKGERLRFHNIFWMLGANDDDLSSLVVER